MAEALNALAEKQVALADRVIQLEARLSQLRRRDRHRQLWSGEALHVRE